MLEEGRESRDTLAATFLDVKISPSIKTSNFLLVRKEALSLMRLFEKANSDNL
jgi:hypothetical protein